MAVVADFDAKTGPKQAAEWVANADVNCVCVSSLTPFSLILFFDNEEAVRTATDLESPLWKTFKRLRRWSEEIECMERIAYLECHGIHPKFLNDENVIKIGELWGDVLFIDYMAQGVNSLTLARLKVRTNAKFRVDTCIKLAYGSESCEVWVCERDSSESFHFERPNHLQTVDIDGREDGESTQLVANVMCTNEAACELRREPLIEQQNRDGQQQYEDPIMLELLQKPIDIVNQKLRLEHA